MRYYKYKEAAAKYWNTFRMIPKERRIAHNQGVEHARMRAQLERLRWDVRNEPNKKNMAQTNVSVHRKRKIAALSATLRVC
tara:strand:+ start:74 stop:316 length:243 start_codon:yes stop_codon:yes gene_type:complete